MEPLTDTHLHLVYPDRFSYPWMEAAPSLKKPFTLEDYEALTREAGIEAALFMEVDVAGEQAASEADFFTQRAEKNDSCLKGVIASARPELDGFSAHLDRIASPRLEAFGPDRLVWGSDWPVCTLTTELPSWIRLFRQWLGKLSKDEQATIAHLNAGRIYSIS